MAAPAAKSRATVPTYAQRDRHAELGELLLQAETAPDDVERMLSVVRVVLRLAVDILRPGGGYADLPVPILGLERMSHRILPERYRGDELYLFLQELASHDAADKPISLASKRRGPEIAKLYMRICPVASVVQIRHKSQRGALSWSGSVTEHSELHVEMTGDGRVSLTQRADTYTFTLPSLRFLDPISNNATVEFADTCTVRCGATGLMATIGFKEGSAIKGTVVRIQGAGDVAIARIGGNWEDEIVVESIGSDAAGTLASAAELRPPASTRINLADPGPRLVMPLWAGIIECMQFIDPAHANVQAGKPDPIVRALPTHLKKALHFEIAQGLRPNNTETEKESKEMAQIQLPPIIKKERQKGHAYSYQLYYSLQAVAP